MITAYDLLKKAAYQSFGKWYRMEYPAITDRLKTRLQTGQAAEEYWETIFLEHLTNLEIGGAYISGGMVGSKDVSKEDRKENIRRLQETNFVCKYWVFVSREFDDIFSLHGFDTKEEMIVYYREMRKEEDVFRCFCFRA